MNDEDLGQKDIVKRFSKNLKRGSTIAKGSLASKIISEYFKIVQIAILSGQEWDLPNFGSISIEGEVKDKPIIPYHYRKKGYRIQYLFDFSRIGEDYTIILKSDFMKKEHYDFKASKTTRGALRRLLINHPEIHFIVKNGNI